MKSRLRSMDFEGSINCPQLFMIVLSSAKRCRERWVEYVDPSLNTSPFTPEEDEFILAYQAAHGNRWKVRYCDVVFVCVVI